MCVRWSAPSADIHKQLLTRQAYCRSINDAPKNYVKIALWMTTLCSQLTDVFIRFGANVDMFLVSLSGALYGSVVYVLKWPVEYSNVSRMTSVRDFVRFLMVQVTGCFWSGPNRGRVFNGSLFVYRKTRSETVNSHVAQCSARTDLTYLLIDSIYRAVYH